MSQPAPIRRARKPVPQVKPAPDVPELPAYTQAVALHALAAGKADAGAQKIALAWIINDAAGMYRQCFHESQRQTDFMLGRAFVGQQIAGVLKMNLSSLQNAPQAQQTKEK